jgi:hypothetical protein
MADLMTILFGTALTGKLRRQSAASPAAAAGPKEESWIASLCRQTRKWTVTGFDGQDRFTVRTKGDEVIYPVTVRTSGQSSYGTRFQCFLPLRFPMETPPSGLFGRLMMRSREMDWSAWQLIIVESCEAQLYVTALIPSAVLDAALFDEVCREQTSEVAAFMKELHDKFNCAGGNSPAPTRPTGPDVPMVRTGQPPHRIP